MAKNNMNILSSDMKDRLEFMMNIYNSFMMSDQDVVSSYTTGTTADYRSLNGYIKLMRRATNSKNHIKSTKSHSRRSTATNNTSLAKKRIHKNHTSVLSVSSQPILSRSPSSVLLDFEKNSVSACFEDTKKLLWKGCKTIDNALDANRDLPMWAQTVDLNNIFKQLLASADASRIEKENLHDSVIAFINYSIIIIDMFHISTNVDKYWWKHSYKIIERLINDITVHCRAKNPNASLKVKEKNDKMLNRALSTITQLKRIMPNDKFESHIIQNPITPVVPPVQQPTYQPPPPDYNTQQYVNYNYSNPNYINCYNYQGPFHHTPQINRTPFCQMHYRPTHQSPYQPYPNQVRVTQPQFYQYLQQSSNPWQNNYQKPPYPIHNTQFPPTQFVTSPQPNPEVKLIEVKEDDEKKWLDAQKGAKKLVNNTINNNITTRSNESTHSSQECEEGLNNNILPTFEKTSDRDSGAPLPDDTDRIWHFLGREVDKKVRYKFQKMIREIQNIPKDEFSLEPELYDTTYQNVIKIQLFESIRCKMINRKYENVQAVVRDFRLVFSTFRHISQQSNDIKCKRMMDFLERHFNECLKKYFRGWNLDKYCPGVIDIL